MTEGERMTRFRAIMPLRHSVVVGLVLGASTIGFLAIRAHRQPAEPSRALVKDVLPALAALEPRVDFSSCRLLRSGSVCERDPSSEPLVVWVEGAELSGLQFTLDSVPIAPQSTSLVQGGRRFELEIAPGAHQLQLVGSGKPVWSLLVREHTPFEWEAAANGSRRAGRFARARHAVARGLSSADLEERSRARAMAARVQLGLGEHAQAVHTLSETAEEAWTQGRISDAVSDALATAYVQIQLLHELEAANATLDRAQHYARGDPAGRADLPFYLGLLAAARGETWAARSRYLEARAAAERLELRQGVRDATVQLAKIDVELGRFAEALEALAHVLSQSLNEPACVLGPLSTNLAWTEMLARQQGHLVPRVDEHLQLALDRNDSCGAPLVQRMDRINLGLRAIALGRLEDARLQQRALAKIAGRGTPALVLWEQELEGQTRLLAGDVGRALAAFSRQASLAEALHDEGGQQRARVGTGDAFERLGKVELALRAYREASEAFGKASGSVPFGVPRDGFTGAHDAPAARLIEALLRHGRLDESSMVALRTFQQSFAGAAYAAGARQDDAAIGHYLDERARIDREAEGDWELSTEQLAVVARARGRRLERAVEQLEAQNRRLEATGEGRRRELRERLSAHESELELLIFPEAQRWRVFGQAAGSLRVTVADAPLADNAAWLDAFEPELRTARRLKLLPYGAAHSVNWANLQRSGRRLIEDHDLSYSLGLTDLDARPAFPLRALVVSDPTSELPNARIDARAVLELFGASFSTFLSGSNAKRETVLAELRRAELFYYSGHGQPASLNGQSGLVLAQGAILTPSDILSLSGVPRYIVLAACDAGAAEREPNGGGWSLAHAFLLAGAEQVIAPVTSVEDAAASRVMSTLIRHLLDSGTLDLVPALSRIQRQTVGQDAATAQSFRVFVR